MKQSFHLIEYPFKMKQPSNLMKPLFQNSTQNWCLRWNTYSPHQNSHFDIETSVFHLEILANTN